MSPKQIAAARDTYVSTVRKLLQRAQDEIGARSLRGLISMLTALQI